MRKKKRSIMLVASVSFYEHLLEIEKELKRLGFTVSIPVGAVKMKRGFDALGEKNNYLTTENWQIKRKLIEDNFKKILESDSLLVINDEKHGITGYIGGNVLMEMTLAFHYKKPIYILNPIERSFSLREEIYGMEPVFLNEDLSKIKFRIDSLY